MSSHGRRGNAIVEFALLMPILLLLTVGTIQFGKFTYLYYVIKKIEFAAVRYLSVQQAVDFCNLPDALTEAAFTYGLTDSYTGNPIVANLTADQLQINTFCIDPATGAPGACDTSGCGLTGAQRPDYIQIAIPNGYQVQIRLPYVTLPTFDIYPTVTVPFNGSAL
ncbi:MAG: TadE/TadG family type IV pilus assembly protein [Bryobacteraceae bacterium]|jgi:Flp pilus assembly protein TadG